MNPIIAKIEKMMRLARSVEGTPEGETAAAIAAKWMRAHAIEMAELDLDRLADVDPLTEKGVRVAKSVWRRNLFHALALHCSCRVLYNSHRGGKGQRITIYGHKSDVEVVEYLYVICERQISRDATAYVKGLESWRPVRRMGNNYRRSAVAGLASKLREMRKGAADTDAKGTALVVQRDQRVEDWFEDTNDYTAGRRSDYNHNRDGYAAGLAVDLAGGVGSSGQQTLRLGGE